MSTRRLRGAIVAAVALAACRDPAPAQSRTRAAERVALDTASRAWRHAAGVDSVRGVGDTVVVWVSPRDWTATDAPQAGVRVAPGGRVVGVPWILGG